MSSFVSCRRRYRQPEQGDLTQCLCLRPSTQRGILFALQ
uniref:Uncharacterized protein n=1 Tax=Pyricularia oryzae (strain P131) TaxID=1143193 RepID=L7J7D8_PYRO1